MGNGIKNNYYILESKVAGSIVLLRSLRGPSKGDDWMLGRKFKGQVKEPVQINAKEDFDKGTLLPLYPTPTIMHVDLYEAILSAGADNIEAWDAIITKADGSILSKQYKAFNILGLVKAAGSRTVYAQENPSRIIDASIESLDLNVNKENELLIFRLAESIGTVIIHEKVKLAIEERNIQNLHFTDPVDFLS
jgi:hypothetical protein